MEHSHRSLALERLRGMYLKSPAVSCTPSRNFSLSFLRLSDFNFFVPSQIETPQLATGTLIGAQVTVDDICSGQYDHISRCGALNRVWSGFMLCEPWFSAMTTLRRFFTPQPSGPRTRCSRWNQVLQASLQPFLLIKI